MSTIGDRLSRLLNDEGISVYELSVKTGISQATFSRLFRGGTKKPNQQTTEMLAKYFNVNEKWLRVGIGDAQNTNTEPNKAPVINTFMFEGIEYGSLNQEQRIDILLAQNTKILSQGEESQKQYNRLLSLLERQGDIINNLTSKIETKEADKDKSSLRHNLYMASIKSNTNNNISEPKQ